MTKFVEFYFGNIEHIKNTSILTKLFNDKNQKKVKT